MSIKSQQANMKAIHSLVSQDLGYIYGKGESGPNGAKKQFHSKSAAFLRALRHDMGFKSFKVTNNHAGIAVSGEITLMGMWSEDNGLYLQISQSLTGRQEFLCRPITHMKDYSSGPNKWIPHSLFASGDYKKLIDILLELNTAKGITRHVA